MKLALCTETALVVITDEIFSNMDSKKVTPLTLCDLSTAFDSVSHAFFLNKCAKLIHFTTKIDSMGTIE